MQSEPSNASVQREEGQNDKGGLCTVFELVEKTVLLENTRLLLGDVVAATVNNEVLAIWVLAEQRWICCSKLAAPADTQKLVTIKACICELWQAIVSNSRSFNKDFKRILGSRFLEFSDTLSLFQSEETEDSSSFFHSLCGHDNKTTYKNL